MAAKNGSRAWREGGLREDSPGGPKRSGHGGKERLERVAEGVAPEVSLRRHETFEAGRQHDRHLGHSVLFRKEAGNYGFVFIRLAGAGGVDEPPAGPEDLSGSPEHGELGV